MGGEGGNDAAPTSETGRRKPSTRSPLSADLSRLEASVAAGADKPTSAPVRHRPCDVRVDAFAPRRGAGATTSAFTASRTTRSPPRRRFTRRRRRLRDCPRRLRGPSTIPRPPRTNRTRRPSCRSGCGAALLRTWTRPQVAVIEFAVLYNFVAGCSCSASFDVGREGRSPRDAAPTLRVGLRSLHASPPSL